MGRLRRGEPGVRAVLAAEAKQDPVFLIQDYHLTLVPRMLRELVPEARILHFSHTPFAGRTYLRTLPGRDALGDAPRDARRRRRRVPGPSVGRELPPVRARAGGRPRRHPRAPRRGRRPRGAGPLVPRRGRRVRDPGGAASDRASGLRTRSRRSAATPLLLRVDRLEPSKNILRGFLAFELFLQKHREWRGEVVFLALLSPRARRSRVPTTAPTAAPRPTGSTRRSARRTGRRSS